MSHSFREPRRPATRVPRRSVLGLGTTGLLAAGGYTVWRGGRNLVPGRHGGHGRHGGRAAAPGPEPRPDDGSGGTGSTGGTGGGPSVDNPRLIGDGSTADTGPQPHQPEARRLARGQPPPQFVVISWDGAGDLDDGLFARFRAVARETDAAMTFFLSGLYLLPEAKRLRYRPPRNPAGASEIGYLSDAHIRGTLKQLRQAWLAGHEIGTHFNGHFCGGPGSVAKWTPQEWASEIKQAVGFVTRWRTNTGFDDLEPLPFDYRKELTGGRTPCLLGQRNLLPTAAAAGWRYDASSTGGFQRWPRRRQGLWDFPLQSVPFPGRRFEVLSMDYNMLATQSKGSARGNPARFTAWRDQARDAYIAGFERAYTTNRAPLFIGNHFEQWNGGIYMDAVEQAIRHMAGKRDVRMVSFRQLCDWLETQRPDVVRGLQRLGVGERPVGGWGSVVTGRAA